MNATASTFRRPVIMGVLNITPDSFSDGGRFERGSDAERTRAAVDHARHLVELGAGIVDVGGESTRPGAPRVPQAEEAARVVPVIAALAEAGIVVSVDTMNAETARAAIAAGAVHVNDVSGGRADAGMLPFIAESGASFMLSHWRGHSEVMNALADYADPAREILAELRAMRDAALDAGVAPEQIILDPGIGFAKRADDNWAVLRSIDEFEALGHPVLLGVSRKRFLGELLPEGAPVRDRDLPTAVLSALCAAAGVWGVRVHDVEGSRIALDAAEAWQTGALRRG